MKTTNTDTSLYGAKYWPITYFNSESNLWFQSPTQPMHLIRFKWRNQKQIRKNRRRAHAAGKKNAFQ